MITVTHETLRLRKRVPLAISRGTSAESIMVWVRVESGGVEGWGEAGEFSIGSQREGLEEILAGLELAMPVVRAADPWDRESIERRLVETGVGSAARAGVLQAMVDWAGRRLGEPVWRLLGLDPAAAPVTSVTIGISEPAAAVARLRQWLDLGDIRAVKVKLGSPAGLEADRQMLEAVHAALPPGIRLGVDANGGWQATDLPSLSRWLAGHGVDHIEQPLPRGRERDLAGVRRDTVLPIIADESCFLARDIPALAGVVDGINIKLMKCGGVPEAIRMIHAARAHGLRIMLGCYGSSALSNTAAAHLGPLVDYLDLDSHLNLVGDPFRGARFVRGGLELPRGAGFGVAYEPAE
ncbi:MAG TPA: dipeptide epimerase [Verrucomicrobiales bacterium]|nr:dipeptide epimerase [Verrucomicrobiales bacterium]